MYCDEIDFKILEGKTLNYVKQIKNDAFEEDSIIFGTTDGNKYKMYHQQDCCESVTIEDICGNLKALVGSPIIVAEERVNDSIHKYNPGSETWTFYEIRTVKASVSIRWCGTSNGYYSESVSFVKLDDKEDE